MSGVVVPARSRRRKGPAQVGNVVPLHTPKVTTEDIVRDVQERSRRQGAEITAMLQNANRELDKRHREHAQQCLSIGYAMCRPELDDWIEIGRRMLAAKGGRR